MKTASRKVVKNGPRAIEDDGKARRKLAPGWMEAPCEALSEPGPEQKRARVDVPPRRGARA